MSTFFACVFLVATKILSTLSHDTCSSHADCRMKKVCCQTLSFPHSFYCLNSYISATRSCVGYYCTKNGDCKGLNNKQRLCCRSNRCHLCPLCTANSDCGQSQVCCVRGASGNLYEQSRCLSSCVGLSCQSNSECGNDCCRSGKCVGCLDSGCRAHTDCNSGKYCCNNLHHGYGRCKLNCIGENCYNDKDCATSERCSDSFCIKDTECESNDNCNAGLYCCKFDLYRITECSRSCIGYMCNYDNDCGEPDVCCRHGKCVKCGHLCRSSFDCFNGTFCCKENSFGESRCAVEKCEKQSCIVTADCVRSDTWCEDGLCSSTKPCNSSSECVTYVGKQHYCCIDSKLSLKRCSQTCNRDHIQCSINTHCIGRNECCTSDGSCTECSWEFPKWLIASLVGLTLPLAILALVYYCTRKKMNAQSDQNHAENTAHLFNNNHERAVQNIYVSQTETALPRANNNEFIELVLQEARNETGREESMPATSTYETRLDDGDEIMPTTPIYVNYITNVPPRFYSFDGVTISQEGNNDLPLTF